jgi:competence protein ComEA
VLGGWWLLGGRGVELAPAPVVPPQVTAASAALDPSADPAALPSAGAGPVADPGAGTTSDPAGGRIVVDVVGRVRRPGIAVLPAGARVVDAVEAAGGLRRGFRAASVNMARLLVDGEQVLIAPGAAPAPAVPGAAGGGAGATGPGLVSLNTADQAALETLPGVGPVTALAILQWRDEHGAFSSVDELLEVSGIGEATLAEIAPHVTL